MGGPFRFFVLPELSGEINMKEPGIQIGGQAVIEGVMMRSKDNYSVAVRRKNGSIFVRVRPFTSFVRKYKIFSLPIMRGGFVLIESLVLGVQALTFSGDIAAHDENSNEDLPGNTVEKKSIWANLWLGITVAFSFVLGLFIFFYVPLLLTEWLGAESGLSFNLVDGALRLAFFLLYLGLITMMKDIRRVFEYHGAEHKSIFTFENGAGLKPAVAQEFSRFHPRCGTSFLLIVMLVSIFVFMFLGKPDTLSERLLRLAFIPVIGGISYELIRFSGAKANSRFLQPFIKPGLWLQKLTTKEPDLEQLEVAIVALKASLGLDMSEHEGVVFEAQTTADVQTVSTI